MRVAKWGNSLAVRLPVGLVDALGLREGDEVEIVVHHAGALAASRHASPEALLLPLRRFRGKLPGDFRFRRNDANEPD
ncbi:AbrB/MazE/SpoVT family DNA-binding domain-containing protein [Burkholderia sp. BCCIQ04A]|uniref:AbrB/MazE/SpoVT family DNA-binding domain-containing protein n=1 Tax=Burkholderia anthinoferrum TaxID=3090833 RepID=A0ABU5WIH3_9BURK|nr:MULTISPECIES: AbrB/MazE/SpoVT family DNA-binding domain-containing protein [Burkholderia]MEB2505747.1 AbrB/MazE/SpoVT family DNA-binding domain-containing protein [Burkholderia anthinoferrum]MEB2531987.1 AbrB/MazE/SpoVT family DNA-binding domain-containing protein [Burkholderia anthinoferrum]MEB2562189.1 AbrB/MazE/SpoVT family DNA-binding domain-containing protein [Burkholderia anthinoferrum]MEB2578801.1 AbrB/MazE/SpoVT family DNA-binding domain-containing protein [Burkholderia anthinoferrum